ncbi:hypothetical protein ACH42_16905 [Endozoicomonas sp. (ex Bugula neritina AB1)]|nr:hypothetical protein ACH42_16905 [Endozoicomonas sp. (ex Bugula neritina AB1)]
MNTIEGIFFDLDGTLLNTAEDFVVTVNQMLDDYKQQPMPAEHIRRNVSAGSRTLMKMAFSLTDGEMLEQRRNEFLSLYNQHIQDQERSSSAQLYPGIKELISAIEERDIIWGVITNKPRAYAEKLLEQQDLLKRTATLLCPDDANLPKPHPESLLRACQQTRCAPEKSIYIGDHIRDIQAGKAAGMITVAAHYGYIADTDDPTQWSADLNINNISEFHHWLNRTDWAIAPRE